MERGIGADKLKAVIRSLDTAAKKAGIKKLKVIVCGGLAVIAYGMTDRQTFDIDAEVEADFRVIEKLKKHLKLPAELTTDISRWSMVDIPPGYKERAVHLDIVETKNIEISFLSPIDLIMSKLRVFRDKDIEDAVFLVRKFKVKKSNILRASRQAIETSPPSTELLRFKKPLQHFIKIAYR